MLQGERPVCPSSVGDEQTQSACIRLLGRSHLERRWNGSRRTRAVWAGAHRAGGTADDCRLRPHQAGCTASVCPHVGSRCSRRSVVNRCQIPSRGGCGRPRRPTSTSAPTWNQGSRGLSWRSWRLIHWARGGSVSTFWAYHSVITPRKLAGAAHPTMSEPIFGETVHGVRCEIAPAPTNVLKNEVDCHPELVGG